MERRPLRIDVDVVRVVVQIPVTGDDNQISSSITVHITIMTSRHEDLIKNSVSHGVASQLEVGGESLASPLGGPPPVPRLRLYVSITISRQRHHGTCTGFGEREMSVGRQSGWRSGGYRR